MGTEKRLGTILNVPKSVTRTSTAFTAVMALPPELLPIGSATTAPPTLDELIVCLVGPSHMITSGVPPLSQIRDTVSFIPASVIAGSTTAITLAGLNETVPRSWVRGGTPEVIWGEGRTKKQYSWLVVGVAVVADLMVNNTVGKAILVVNAGDF